MFRFLKFRRRDLARYMAITMTILLLGPIFLSAAQASPPAQDPRPTAGNGNGGAGGGGGVDGDEDRSPTELRCASLTGQVITWGVGGAGEITTELSTGSWQASAISASDGNYSYGGLGVGIATLRVLLAPAQVEHLQPLIQNASIYLNCDFPTIANLALFSGPHIEPPVTIQMSAPARLSPGSDTQIRLIVNNDLPNEITNVIVTNLMPLGLVALDVPTVSTPSENVKIINGGDDGQLVVVYLDKVAAGDEANIIITVTTAEDIPANTQIRNTATLFYRESAAVQAWFDFTVGYGGPAAPAAATLSAPSPEATSTPGPQPSATPAPAVTPTDSLTSTVESETAEDSEPPSATSTISAISQVESETAEEEFVPPPEALPPGGGPLPEALPSGGDPPPEPLPPGGGDAVPQDLLPITGKDMGQSSNRLLNIDPGIILPLSLLGLIGLASLAYGLRSYRNE
jgi:hypothetical protein